MPTETQLPEEIITINPEQVFSAWEDRISQLESEAGAITDNKVPDWYLDSSSDIWSLPAEIGGDDPSLPDVTRYYELFSREYKITSAIKQDDFQIHPFYDFAYRMGTDVVANVMAKEDSNGFLHSEFLGSLSLKLDAESISIDEELEVLKSLYNLNSASEVLGVKGDSFTNKLQTLIRTPKYIEKIHFADGIYDSESSIEENNQRTLDWLKRTLSYASGIDEDLAESYVFSASKFIDEKVALLKVVEAFDYFGKDRLQNITKFTGIYGLEGYTISQLERMEYIANNPVEAANELRNRDVIVLMTNRVGDYNGVLNGEASNVEDETGRVLFFEINKMSDIFRRMTILNRLGINPSTLILASHSNKGQFMVSDDRDPGMKRMDIASVAGQKLVEWANVTPQTEDEDALAPGRRAFSMNGMSGMARLVDEYMKPSRAIEDVDSDLGRKKIIFAACYAAAETEVMDISDDGEKLEVGLESVTSQLAKDLMANGSKSEIDIYGASEGIKVHRTGNGLGYSTSTTDFKSGRPAHPATRIRVEDGQVAIAEVDEIVLRK
ncbi:MAG: hypothetical protein QG628_194 [Patescibacteria group bacterium]|nr:hypothetical protein [Patescibacteria group bacterium]